MDTCCSTLRGFNRMRYLLLVLFIAFENIYCAGSTIATANFLIIGSASCVGYHLASRASQEAINVSATDSFESRVDSASYKYARSWHLFSSQGIDTAHLSVGNDDESISCGSPLCFNNATFFMTVIT